MATKDIINFKALSRELTGSEEKIRKNGTAEKYVKDVQELEDMINLWLSWKRSKHG